MVIILWSLLEVKQKSESSAILIMNLALTLVPTLCVGTVFGTLCVLHQTCKKGV